MDEGCAFWLLLITLGLTVVFVSGHDWGAVIGGAFAMIVIFGAVMTRSDR